MEAVIPERICRESSDVCSVTNATEFSSPTKPLEDNETSEKAFYEFEGARVNSAIRAELDNEITLKMPLHAVR